MFQCWCLHALPCLGRNPQDSRSFWPLLQYAHWYHVASTRYLRIWGKSLMIYISFGPQEAVCTWFVLTPCLSVLQSVEGHFSSLSPHRLVFLPEASKFYPITPCPSQVSILSDSYPCLVKSLGFCVLSPTVSKLLVSPSSDSQLLPGPHFIWGTDRPWKEGGPWASNLNEKDANSSYDGHDLFPYAVGVLLKGWFWSREGEYLCPAAEPLLAGEPEWGGEHHR